LKRKKSGVAAVPGRGVETQKEGGRNPTFRLKGKGEYEKPGPPRRYERLLPGNGEKRQAGGFGRKSQYRGKEGKNPLNVRRGNFITGKGDRSPPRKKI